MAHNAYDADRRSAVSSFYGGRKSTDILASDVGMHGGPSGGRGGAGSTYTGSQQRGGRADRDDASSFFAQPNSRPSQERLGGNTGYNRESYFALGREAPVKFGRDEEEAFIGAGPGAEQEQPGAGWDVYADFNNVGPRYSTAFTKYDEGYQRLPPDSQAPPSIRSGKLVEDTHSMNGPVELVTVPALGAEWRKDELKAMTKKGKKEMKEDNRWQNFRAWTRDQRGCCGKWGTRKQVAIGSFIVCVIIGLVLAFTIPRVPGFAFASTDPLKNGTAPPETIFSRSPANFSFASNLDLQVDTDSNFLPLKFNHLRAKVFDLETDFLVGTGDLSGKTLPAKKLTEIFLPLNFTYIATNDSDTTWNNWYNACKNHLLYANGSRPGVNFRLELTMDISGLIGSHKTATQITNANCPVELSENNA